MVNVAIIGSGELGSLIIRAIARRPQHTVKVLARRPRPDLEAEGIEVAVIDFADPSALVKTLNGIHTLISIVFDTDPVNFERTQKILIDAAKEAGVTRFAPSEWCWSEEFNNLSGNYIAKRGIMKYVRESGLEYTAFRNGFFTNRLAFGAERPDVEAKAFVGLSYFDFMPSLNIANKGEVVEIPGTGNEPFNMTLTHDVAEMVAESLDKKWAPESGMGSIVTFNQLIEIWEKVTGKKAIVKYVPVEEYEKKLAALGPGQPWFVALPIEIPLGMAKGWLYSPPVLNELVGYKPTTPEEWIKEWWSPVEASA